MAQAATAATAEMNRIVQEKSRVEGNLKSLKKQLAEYQLKLSQTRRDEARSVKALNTIRRQIQVYERLISENQSYLNSLNREIGYLSSELEVNRQNYGRVSGDFQRVAVAAYKHGGRRDAQMVFASGSVNDAVVRTRYIGFLSRSVNLKVNDLQTSAQKMETARAELERSYRQKEEAMRLQQAQLQDYASKQKEKEAALSSIKKDKKAYATQITQVRQKQRALQARIESLIMAQQSLIQKEQERTRLAQIQRQKQLDEARRLKAVESRRSRVSSGGVAPAKRTTKAVAKEAPLRSVPDLEESAIEKVSANFDRAMGGLPWPVRGGVVVRRFGTTKDRELNIVTTSNGIDISVPVGTAVSAVSGGKVAQVAYLPTFGNVVIVRHPNSYLTVYANLARVSVSKGDVIQSRHLLGSSGAMPEGGSIVHFEVWKGKVKQNPEKWLR